MPEFDEKTACENLHIAAEYANREFNRMVLTDPWWCHSSHYVLHVMNSPVVRNLVRGYGVEPVLWEPEGGFREIPPEVFQYGYAYVIGEHINQGDPYVETLIFLPSLTTFDYDVQNAVFERIPRPDWNREGCFVVASVADILEWLDADHARGLIDAPSEGEDEDDEENA